jgi:hypothetical protein
VVEERKSLCKREKTHCQLRKDIWYNCISLQTDADVMPCCYRWIGKKDEKLTEVEETIRLSAIQNSHVVIPALVNNNLPTSSECPYY